MKERAEMTAYYGNRAQKKKQAGYFLVLWYSQKLRGREVCECVSSCMFDIFVVQAMKFILLCTKVLEQKSL